MSAAPRLGDYLDHLAEALDRIERYTSQLAAEDFAADVLVQDAVIRNLEIVGEACRNIARRHPEFAAAHPELPLAAAYEMRNALAHGYFKVDLDIVWTTVRADLPRLREQLRNLERRE